MESVRKNLVKLCHYTDVNEELLVTLFQEEVILQSLKDELTHTNVKLERASKLYTHILTKTDAEFSTFKTALDTSGNKKALEILNKPLTEKPNNPSTRSDDNTLEAEIAEKSKPGKVTKHDAFAETNYTKHVPGPSTMSVAPNVQSFDKPTLNPTLTCFGITPLVRNFTGRGQELSKLQKIFKSKVKYALVCGLGGIGKTELVKKFAHIVRQDNHVTWLNGDTPTSLISSIKELAEHLEIHTSKNGNNDELHIFKRIVKTLSRQMWLMIIDNVDETYEKYESVIKFTIDINNICVVVTSQSRLVLDEQATLIEIDNLLPEDAFKFVNTSLESENSAEDIEHLCTTLQYFPLALQQAIAYTIQQQRKSTLGTKYSIQEYLKEFECQKMKVFDHKPGITNEYGKTVLITWNLTTERLRISNQLQYQQVNQILAVLAFLDADNLHLDFLFQIVHLFPKSKFLTFFQRFYSFFIHYERIEYNGEMQLKKSSEQKIETLKNYSIIKVENNYISVHRLVQELIRFQLDKNTTTKILDTIITNVDIENLQKHAVLHILSVWKHIQIQTELFKKHKNVTSKIYNRLYELSLYYESLRFAKNNFKLFKEMLGENDYHTLVMEGCIACATKNIGKYEEALELLETILPRMQRILGKYHDQSLVTAESLGTTFFNLERYPEALQIYYENLDIIKKKYGKDHTSTITTKRNIATVFHLQENYTDANELYQEVLKSSINNLGQYHRSTLITRQSIAVCLFHQSKYEEALIEFEVITELMLKYLGEEQANTLHSKCWLARTLKMLGQGERALQIINEVLPIQISLLGEDHPDTIAIKFLIELLT